ncbi:MAG: CPBP family intramembrane metalloprotease [Clostridia bacterium]|nr:CPBP family intramembrane metalloprotease [Clostridia bacterium]
MRRVNASHPFFAAPALVLVISVFMLFVRFANLDTDNEAVIYGVMLVLQLLVFAVPTGGFCYLRGKKYVPTLDIYAPRKHSMRVIILGALLIMLASGVLKFGLFHFAYDYSAYLLYGSSITLNTGSFGGTVLMVLSLAVLPAITEEFIFRGIVLSEYRAGGSVFSLVFSSLLFAFVHFDLPQFPIYFLLGMLLGWVAYITRSVWASAAVHLAYNLYVIFFEKYIWLFSSNPDSDILFWLILTAAMFVCAFFFLGAAERVMRYCAENGDSAPKPLKKKKLKAQIVEAIMEKPFLAEVALFVIVGLIVM